MDLTWFGWYYIITSIVSMTLIVVGAWARDDARGYTSALIAGFMAFSLWGVFHVGVVH